MPDLLSASATQGLLVVEPSAMPAAQRRGVGKTDALDAVRIARSVLAVDTVAVAVATGNRPTGDVCVSWS